LPYGRAAERFINAVETAIAAGNGVSHLQKESAQSWQPLKFPSSMMRIRFFVLALYECIAECVRANFNSSRTGLALREGVQRAKDRHFSGRGDPWAIRMRK